jgi:hypothetical protein
MLMRDGRQVFESRTNRNLFLHRDFDSNGEGTFTLARLLHRLGSWTDCFPLLFETWWFTDDGKLRFNDWASTPDWDNCLPLQDLAGYCQSDSQRAFFWRYVSSQYRVGVAKAWEEWFALLRGRADLDGHLYSPSDQYGDEGLVWKIMDLEFGFPAAIPEVWLNYVGWDKTTEDEAHLAENPQRVDFVILAHGQKCVVEIDGPSHYADYDEQSRSYAVNEHRYAKNLAIERSLRRHGWEIHRFANVEIDGITEDDDFVRLAEHLPGFAASWYPEMESMGRPSFSWQLLDQTLGVF